MSREDQRTRSDGVRKAILDTALEIGLQEGFEAISVRKIINKMKYSTGVVYHYFTDKQGIIDALEEAETEKFRETVSSLLDESRDTAYNVTTVFHRIMRLALEEPEKYNLIVMHKYARNNPSPPMWLSFMAENLKRDMESGKVRQLDAEKAAFSIWSSFVGFNLMISRLPNLSEDEAELMFKTQSEIILKGITNNE
ncbi:MAG: TetR/AcrR family transcriptional regulator [Oscillospiraceae bacterium]